jgi:adenosine deaminase CECR1
LELAPLFIQSKNRAERAGTTLPLFLHAGESAHRGFGNIVDAVLLDATRIGHGLSLVDHPTLRARIKAQSIAIEICPYSSYVLGNISDVGQHPARAWLRDGMRICVNPDNPGLMGCDLARDWYLVFVTWQLGLAELKKLVQNGIDASSLPRDQRQDVMREWERRWNRWIAAIDREAQNQH